MNPGTAVQAVEKELRRRLRLEKMLTDISTKAIAPEIPAGFQNDCLQTIGLAMDVSRSYILEHRQTTDTMDSTFEWCAAGVPAQKESLQGVPCQVMRWWIERMRHNEIVNFSNIEDIPSEPERELLRQQNIKSILAVPLFMGKEYFGFMGFDECRDHRQWQAEDINLLKTIAQILSGWISRTRANEALLFERRQLLSIFESIDHIIYVADPNTYEILFVNAEVRRRARKNQVGGICYEEFQGKSAPCDFCTNPIILKQKYEPYKWEFSNPFLKKSFMLIDRIIKWPDGRDVRFEMAVDITDRKKAEQALAESEEKYRQLFEMESDALFMIDNETGKLLEANAACESLYGYGRDKLLGMANTELSAEPEATRQATRGAFTSVPVRYHKNKAGTVFPVEIAARHFTWKGRNVHVAAIRDITARIASDNEKAQLETQLRQAQKMESIGTLAGGIAHDFNNILSAIIGYTEISQMAVESKNPVHRHLGEVLKASQRAKSLVAQILAFSRQTQSEFGPVQIRLIALEAIKMLRATLPASIEVVSDLWTQAMALADSNQIHQVIMNLCTNAFHAMRASGGRLSIGLTESTLDESAAAQLDGLKPGAYLKLVVSDTGVGMDRETIGRIFDPYFTTKAKGEGTGLGLSMAYGIVKAHQGMIAVESQPGQGTAFAVYLPKLESYASLRAAENHAVLPHGHERILCVDDQPELVNMTKAMLETLGYKVTTRSSSLEALELFGKEAQKFDLVITDLNMPHLVGDRLAQEMLKIRPGVPIILCTGFSDQIKERDLAAAGIRAVALKPLLMADLAKLIRKVLDDRCGIEPAEANPGT
ncbi:MAG: ATP-binding protein [Desulfatitalea sp.]